MPLNIPLPDNAIGVEDDPLPEVTQDIKGALAKVWECAMESEAEVLRTATMRPVTLECKTFQQTTRVRMRLYRCKRLLQDQGNKYVRRLGISVQGKAITISITEDLMSLEKKDGEG